MEDKKYAVYTQSWTDPWEQEEILLEYRFSKPSREEIFRFNKAAPKTPGAAQQNLVVACIHPEDREKLLADIERWPALLAGLAVWLLKAAGLSSDLGN